MVQAMRKHTVLAVALLAACQTAEPPARVAARHDVGVAARRASDVTAPFTLTASDGSGLGLTRVDAKAVVQGPLAFTELHLYFKNPENRTREGTFVITLPPGAAVSRFAMEIEGKLQEAEVVEKQVARRIYDDFLHRKQDPALLEKSAGNQFSAKVFPIPAQAVKHLVVSYSQDVTHQSYVLPLRGLPLTQQVDAQLTVTGVDGKPITQTLRRRDWQPDTDFASTIATLTTGVAAGNLVVASVVLSAPDGVTNAAPTALTLLVDTSASRALGFADYVASIRDLVDGLRTKYGDITLDVVAFDQDTQVIYQGKAAGYGVAQERALLARGAAGASDLAQAIAAVQSPQRRVVVVTDGVLTAGAEGAALADAIEKMPTDRIDVVLVGGIRDERAARAIARTLPKPGDVLDLEHGVAEAVAALGETVLTDIPVDVPGASWVYPRTVTAARAGRPVLIYARLERPMQELTVKIAGARRALPLVSASPALVERAIASAEIDELEMQLSSTRDDAAARQLRDDIAKRSVKSRVVSSQTAMLVLERESDYERYQLPRTALADILVVGPRGLEQQKRSDVLMAEAERESESESQSWTATMSDRFVLLNEGAAGSSTSRRTDGHIRIQSNNVDPQVARQQAIEEARSAGALGSSSLTAGGNLSSGFDDADVYGGLLGSEPVNSNGWGFGRSGFGPGGGGTGWGTIGTGRYGTIGHGSGTGTSLRARSAAVPTVRVGTPAVAGGELDRAIIRRYVKRNIAKLQYCYEKELLAKPALAGTINAAFVIDTDGAVLNSTASGFDPDVAQCVGGVVASIQFPRPVKGTVRVSHAMTFGVSDGSKALVAPPPAAPPEYDGDHTIPPLTGKLAEVTEALAGGNITRANDIANTWHAEAPGDVLALIALGEVLEKRKDAAQAARIYGSIIDLYPNRADMRRFAGERLERLGKARSLIVDTYRRAVADRPDHATGHRLLAYALLRNGDLAGAFDAILAGIDQPYPSDRFYGANRILFEDAGMIGAAYAASGGPRDTIDAALAKRKLGLITTPSTRFIMYWETDSNDVDFHIKDAEGGHAWYQSMKLPSGGELYADVRNGYGPECFTVPGTPKAGPYKLSINYYSQGPMGYGMGLLQVQRFTGKDFKFEDRPYVVMNNQAFVELGSYQ